MDQEVAGKDAPIRVLVVARQPIMRAGLVGLLGQREEIALVGESSTAAEAEQALDSLRPDLLLAAWTLPLADELAELAERVSEAGLPVLVLADAPSPGAVAALVRSGVRGVLRSEAGVEEIAAGVRAAVQGLLVLESGLGKGLTSAMPVSSLEDGGEEPLTERELQVLQLLAVGLPNKNIAARLKISEHTVKFHVGSILGKLGVSSRTEAVTHAARRGLLIL